MKLRYNYRLYPTESQKALLQNHFFTSNQAFNIAINLNLNQYNVNLNRKSSNLNPIHFSSNDLDSLIKLILRKRNLQFNTKIIQQSRKNFEDSLSRYFKSFDSSNVFGKLKFKKSDNKSGSLETTAEQYNILDYIDEAGNVSKKWKILRLFNQSFKIRWSRDLPSSPKTLTIKLHNNKYFISFVVDKVNSFRKSKYNNRFLETSGDIKKLDKSEFKKLRSSGLDINLLSIDLGNKKFHKKFLTKSSKKSIQKNLKKIKLLKRKQSKRVLKSLAESKKSKIKFELPNNFNKTQDKINKLSDSISNKRDFNLHQLINELITFLKENKINHLVIEDLDVKSMTSKENINSFLGKSKTKSMRKNILDISFGKMINIIRYKCAMNYIYLSLVDPKNTSKMCSNKNCNTINTNLNLSDRTFNCPNCSLNIDRDYNSALNIEQKGMIQPG